MFAVWHPSGRKPCAVLPSTKVIERPGNLSTRQFF